MKGKTRTSRAPGITFPHAPVTSRTALPLCAPLAAALLVALAAPAWGTEGQEVFARGFGSKAAAMGNSFVSIADDASTVFWNPAGAGWLARKTLTVSITDMYFSDVDYSSISYVHPLSRLGALGLSLTRWSVEDIEQRDENNLLIRDNLTDRQMELIASYSSPPLHNLTAAIGMKLDTQTLEDEEALGMGVDLGLLYRCGSRPGFGGQCLSAGVNVRNLVKPILEMREERTYFPTQAVLSASYSRGPSNYLDNWTVAFDLNAPSDLPAFTNFGLEASVEPVRLRLGSMDGHMTAGFGTVWEGFSVDYAYTDEDYGRLHTFSLTLSFGAPSTELGALDDETGDKVATQ